MIQGHQGLIQSLDGIEDGQGDDGGGLDVAQPINMGGHYQKSNTEQHLEISQLKRELQQLKSQQNDLMLENEQMRQRLHKVDDVA